MKLVYKVNEKILGYILDSSGIKYNIEVILEASDTVAIDKLLDKYEFYVSKDGENWGESVAKGKVKNYGKEMYKAFTERKIRYVKIKALSSIGGNTVAIGEINVYAADS